MEEIRFTVVCDRSPSGDTFQVIELRHETGADYTFLIAADDRFTDFQQLRRHIAAGLRVSPEEIHIEET